MAGFGAASRRPGVDRAEAWLEALGRSLYRHRWLSILIVLLASAALAMGLRSLRVDTSVESFLKRNDPVRVDYDQFRVDFGTDEVIRLAIETPDSFTIDSLEHLRALHEELENELPFLDEVESLITARFTHGTESELRVGELFEDWPPTTETLEFNQHYARENPIYRNLLLSDDGRFSVVAIRLVPDSEADTDALSGFDDSPSDRSEATGEEVQSAEILRSDDITRLMHSLEPIVAKFDRPDFKISIAGRVPMNHRMAAVLGKDMGRFASLAVVAVGIILFVLYRRVSFVVLPLACIGFSWVGLFGAMGYLNFPVTTLSQILPSLLLAVGMGSSIHLISIFSTRLYNGDCREDAIAHALRHSGLPILMTSFTTAGSLFSFAFTDLAVISEFGIAAAVGVLLTLLYSVFFLPALLSAVPLRQRTRRTATARTPHGIDRLLLSLARYGCERPVWVIAAFGVVVVAGAIGAVQLRVSHSPVEWLPKDEPYRLAFELVDRELNGSMTMELVVDSGEPDGVKSPAFLQRLSDFQAQMRSFEDSGVHVGNAIALPDIVKETHRALNENRPDEYRIADDPLLISQELLLFENTGADEIEKLADSEFRRARVTLLIDYADALYYRPFLAAVQDQFLKIFGTTAQLTGTGLTFLAMASFDSLLSSLLKSYGIALLIIVPLMILLIGDLRAGLMSMIPNLTPIALTLGFMYWVDIPLDIFTILIGSIGIGVAVDDTVHFMHGFAREYRRLGDVEAAVQATLLTTGRAMLTTSIVLIAGFLVFTASSMANIVAFGVITSLAVGIAFLCDVLLSPALVVLFFRYTNE